MSNSWRTAFVFSQPGCVHMHKEEYFTLDLFSAGIIMWLSNKLKLCAFKIYLHSICHWTYQRGLKPSSFFNSYLYYCLQCSIVPDISSEVGIERTWVEESFWNICLGTLAMEKLIKTQSKEYFAPWQTLQKSSRMRSSNSRFQGNPNFSIWDWCLYSQDLSFSTFFPL